MPRAAREGRRREELLRQLQQADEDQPVARLASGDDIPARQEPFAAAAASAADRRDWEVSEQWKQPYADQLQGHVAEPAEGDQYSDESFAETSDANEGEGEGEVSPASNTS